MMNDSYQIQDILHYTRKSSKKSRNGTSLQAFSSRIDDLNEESREFPLSDRVTADTASCSCDLYTEADIANILHKKCPVIALAQQQLQRILDETDKLLCDNTHCCRSIYDVYVVCKDILWNQNKCNCAVIFVLIVAFIIGLILGAASCGTNLRKFNSPILTCIDKWFISDTNTHYATPEDSFRGIV